jgi:hypothetical protein
VFSDVAMLATDMARIHSSNINKKHPSFQNTPPLISATISSLIIIDSNTNNNSGINSSQYE